MHLTRDNHVVMLDQERFVDGLLERFNMTYCITVSTLTDLHSRLTKTESRTEEERQRMEEVPFRQLLGGLQFIAHCTRPHSAYAVRSFSSESSEMHWITVKRILR